MEASKKSPAAQRPTVIVGLGKATQHMLAGKKEGEPHVISERGDSVIQRVRERYQQLVKEGREVQVIFAGRAPNYTATQKLIPFLRKHIPDTPQAEMFKEAAVQKGVQEGHIKTIPTGTDMMQNLVAVKNYLKDLKVKPKLEIHVDGYQTKRAEMVARHVLEGYELEVKPVYAPRGFGTKLYETLIYEPVETAYMWAGVRIHRAMHNSKYGKPSQAD